MCEVIIIQILLSRYNDSLRAGQSGNRIPAVARCYAVVQTGPAAYQLPVRLVLGLFREGKATGAWCWPPTPIWRRGWRKSRAIPLFPVWVFMACSTVTFTYTCYYRYLNCRTAQVWAMLTHNKFSPLYVRPWVSEESLKNTKLLRKPFKNFIQFIMQSVLSNKAFSVDRLIRSG